MNLQDKGEGAPRRLRLRLRRISAGTVLAVSAPLAVGLGVGAGSPAQAYTSAPPQGAVSGTGCTYAGGAVCDVYAEKGSFNLAGQASAVPFWGFAASAVTPTGAAPVLVVAAGQSVTLTLHNDIGQPMSLALPGVTGLQDDTAGVASGAAKSYTFTAPASPGTYVYEAGRTDGGPRQVAMGLVGAMVVRPSGFAAGSQSVLGTGAAPASGFDDEAVMVLTDVDPDFNRATAAGTAADLRNYHATYHMINGKSFPETDPISTDPGRRVLLRYVNGGLGSHSMGTMGARQRTVAVDGRPSDGAALVADQIPAGGTEDAVVTVPGNGKYAVYDTSGLLNSAGLMRGSSNEVAFGGAMAFIDTAAPLPSPDQFGPRTSGVTVDKTSVMPGETITVTATMDDSKSGHSGIINAEVLIDDEVTSVAAGSGRTMTAFPIDATSNPPATVTAALPVTLTPELISGLNLAKGSHTFYVRGQDSAGNWGAVSSVRFTVPSTGPETTGLSVTPAVTNGGSDLALSSTGDDTALKGTVDQWRWTIDNPTFDSATSPVTTKPVGTPGMVTADSDTIPAAMVTALHPGQHFVYVQHHDTFGGTGLWGPVAEVPLVLDVDGPASVNEQDGVSPKYTNGKQGDPADGTSVKVYGTFHDNETNVVAAEGFLALPGAPTQQPSVANGRGFTFLAKDGKWDTGTEATYGLIPLSQLTAYKDGDVHVWMHAKDQAGNWGPLQEEVFTVDRAAPVVVSLAAAFNQAANLVNLTGTATDNPSGVLTDPRSGLAAAEWFEGADPGAGHGQSVALVDPPTDSRTYGLTADVSGLAIGAHTLSVRVLDGAGTWSAVKTVKVTVPKTDRIFADSFASGTSAAWNNGVGGGSAAGRAVTAAAGLDGTPGLAVTGSGNLTSYLIDPTPAADTSYRGRFSFAPNTLVTGSNTVTLLSGRAARAGTELFSVQYQRNGAGGTPQVRLAIRNSNGGTVNGAWVPLTTASVTINVAWQTGATSASLTVTPSSGPATTSTVQAGNKVKITTGTTPLETVYFGITAATRNTRKSVTAGTGYLDAYVSNRTTTP